MTEIVGTNFLYPFIAASERDSETLLKDLATSARGKANTSAALQQVSVTEHEASIQKAADAMAARFTSGGRLFTFGNGGSSTDAATLAALFCRPAVGQPVAAWSLAADQAVLTALGNDIGFEAIFSRQLIAHGKAQDVAIAMSTSGNSDDLVNALAEARRRGMLTIGFSGYDGGRFAETSDVDFCFTIRSQSIHRIQESQALVGYRLWARVQAALNSSRSVTTASATSVKETNEY